jgi:hypothetical protein
MQLYLHPVRRIYDIHLKEFLAAALPNGRYSAELKKHLQMNDSEMLAMLYKAARKPGAAGHDPARRIVGRGHFRLLYRHNAGDPVTAASLIYAAACAHFGEDAVRIDHYRQHSNPNEFPVLLADGRIVPAITLSSPIKNTPLANVDCVFTAPEHIAAAKKWLDRNRAAIFADVSPIKEEE